MIVVMSPISNHKQNPGFHRCRRRISICKTAIISFLSLQILILLVLTPRKIIRLAEGWSPSTFGLQHGVRKSSLAPRVFPVRKESLVKLLTSSGDLQSDFFEDPTKTIQNGSNATAIATENKRLQNSIRILEEENRRLKKYVEQQYEKAAAPEKKTARKRIVLETFEGEGLFDSITSDASSQSQQYSLADIDQEGDDSELWCDVLDGDECPVEPRISFGEALRDRAYWLVGLLIMQSLSGIILSRNEMLLANHPVIIYYLTMMVGAGGNAGNQASVRGTCGRYLVPDFIV